MGAPAARGEDWDAVCAGSSGGGSTTAGGPPCSAESRKSGKGEDAAICFFLT
jgi:hypothetical protein